MYLHPRKTSFIWMARFSKIFSKDAHKLDFKALYKHILTDFPPHL